MSQTEYGDRYGDGDVNGNVVELIGGITQAATCLRRSTSTGICRFRRSYTT